MGGPRQSDAGFDHPSALLELQGLLYLLAGRRRLQRGEEAYR
jgi:hypothetical protein